jgi:hypothetical protein
MRIAMIAVAVLGLALPCLAWGLGLVAAPPEPASSALLEPAWKQWLVVLTGFAVKPAYMLAALVLAWRLRRAHGPGHRALCWALWAFFAGEAACACNYLACDEQSLLADTAHSWGMVLAAAGGAWAVAAALRPRLVPDDGECALAAACRPCTRAQGCRADRLLPLAPLLLAAAALVPLTVELRPIAASTVLLGTPYAYRHEWAQLAFELRWCPLLAIALALVALGCAWRDRRDAAFGWTCAAAGPLAFAWFRAVLALWHDDPAWFLAWEELAELATVAGIWWWLHCLPPDDRSCHSP